MKKPAILLGLMMGLSSGLILAEGQKQATAPKPDPVAEAKAKETCTKKGLAGSMWDQCVQKELQTLTQATATTTTTAPQPKPAN